MKLNNAGFVVPDENQPPGEDRPRNRGMMARTHLQVESQRRIKAAAAGGDPIAAAKFLEDCPPLPAARRTW